MILLSLLIALTLFLVIGLFRTHNVASHLARLSPKDLIAKLQQVEMEGISAIAVEYLTAGETHPPFEPDRLWNMIGKAQGLARMRANADVLIALAAHAQQWNLEEGLMVAERMRRDGLALRRAVVGIGLGKTCGYGKARVTSYVYEAAGAYYQMRKRLLALYESTSAGLYPSLAAAL